MTVILQQIGRYKLWLVLMGLCFLIQAFQLEAYLRFDRALLDQWQLWRLLTAHLTHLNWSHFFLNMAGLCLFAFFFSAYRSSTYWLLAIVFISLFCSAGIMIDMQYERYVGFSGVLHGLFIIGGRWELQRYKLSGVMLLLLIVAKIAWEQLNGALPGSESMTGGSVAINAHLYGAVAGLVYLLLIEIFRKKAQEKENANARK